MNISSSDMRCRYLAAPGTGTEASFPFGDHLKSHEIQLPDDCSLDYMVRAGWISPILRVPLPRAALESWENFPELPASGTEGCSAEDAWSLELWDKTLATPWPQSGHSRSCWQHFLDDAADPLGVIVRAHAIDRSDASLLPAVFVHPRTGKEVRPWMDFFAYWQAYQVAELLGSATRMFRVTPGFDVRVAANANATLEWVAKFALGIRKKWEARSPTFEWLSRFRTILAAGMERWGDVEKAARDSAQEQGLTPERVTAEIRDTLLVTWNDLDWNGKTLPGGDELRASLRQDIELALCLLRILAGRPIDFLAPDWTDPDPSQRSWAQLIDALPRDIELARKCFSQFALPYLDGYIAAAHGELSVDGKAIDDLLASFWNESRALRRFCLAFFRMNQELNNSGCASGKDVLHSNEGIEQLFASILHAEKLVVAMDRKRKPGGQRSTQDVAKDQLNLLLGKLNLGKNLIRLKVMSKFDELYKERGKLHDLDTRGPRIFISPEDIGSGSAEADYLAAAHVNFVIARNYAAHHDSLDEEITAQDALDPSLKLGRLATESMLTVVLACLQTVR